MRILLKLFGVMVMLSICAIPARSTSNCGYARSNLAGDVKTYQQYTNAILQEIVTYNIKCTDSSNNSVYDTTSDSVTATGGKGGQHASAYYPCNAVFGFSSYSTTNMSGAEPSFTLFAQEYQINSSPGNPACLQTQLIGSTVYCYQVACPTASCTGSPVIVDPTGTGFALTSAANGVKFDIAGLGKPVKIAWSAGGASTAFLALPGSDGLVHNGQQLFGNFTPQPITAGVSPNGFAALAVYDDPKNGGNGDGIIDARDPVFASLRLWVDTNHDGISQPGELYPLLSLGINSISLNYKQVDKVDQYGNIFRYRTRLNPDFPTDAGKIAYDVFLVIDQSTAKRRTTSPHFQQVGINVRPHILAQTICP